MKITDNNEKKSVSTGRYKGRPLRFTDIRRRERPVHCSVYKIRKPTTPFSYFSQSDSSLNARESFIFFHLLFKCLFIGEISVFLLVFSLICVNSTKQRKDFCWVLIVFFYIYHSNFVWLFVENAVLLNRIDWANFPWRKKHIRQLGCCSVFWSLVRPNFLLIQGD